MIIFQNQMHLLFEESYQITLLFLVEVSVLGPSLYPQRIYQ